MTEEQQKPVAEEAKRPKTAVAPEVTTPASGSALGGKKKKVAKRQVPRGNAYVQATYNNTIVTITDPTGNVLGWSSSEVAGFTGPKKPRSSCRHHGGQGSYG